MKKLNNAAKAIMNRLTQGLTKIEDHRKIDNAPGTFMAVHVEHLGNTAEGPLFSVAHYYEQNGDLMKDPDMVFLHKDGNYYPIEFQQDNISFYSCAVKFGADGRIEKYSPSIQGDMVSFANNWMLNILMQQKIKLEQDPAQVHEEIRSI